MKKDKAAQETNVAEPAPIRLNHDTTIDELGEQIVVIDSGFVYAGVCSVDARWLYIHNAVNVRKWGTTQGLGELRNGPTGETVLDKVGEVLVPMARVNHFIQIKKNWKFD